MSFIPAEVIKRKRDGLPLSAEEISFFVNGYSEGSITEGQMAALLMAVFFTGMNDQETHCITQTMLHSGDVLDFSNIKAVKVDKHSTGGVGDKTSLILAPMVASLGLAVPMISGRGLGHTGGTLDKLESIPGFETRLSEKRFRELVEKHGLCFMGQTDSICPADKKIYALRDVTGTIESIPLICASIMSKKLAEGIDALVLDVKFGSGAFMKSLNQAETLARRLISIGQQSGKKVRALLTSMEQPLGYKIGNALEVEECVSILKNEKNDRWEDTRILSIELAAQMLSLGQAASSIEEARWMAEETLSNGKAFEKFEEVCRAHGGDLTKLPSTQNTLVLEAPREGNIFSFDNEQIGLAALELGAGRAKSTDSVDPTAGLLIHKKLGQVVTQGEPLFTLISESGKNFDAAKSRLLKAVNISEKIPNPAPLITKVL